MIKVLAVALATLTLSTAIPSVARADAAADYCHRMATTGTGLTISFEAACAKGNPDDVALFCVGLTRHLQFDFVNQDIRYFVTAKGMCRGPKPMQAFCGLVRSFDGYTKLKDDDQAQQQLGVLTPDDSDPDSAALLRFRARSAELCSTTTEAIHAELCGRADAEHRWDFAEAECPAVIKSIHTRECPANRKRYWDGEGGNASGVDRKVLEKDSYCAHLDAFVKTLH